MTRIISARLREPRQEAIFFETNTANLSDLICWLGSDFYAFTSGREVQVDGRIFKHSRIDDPAFGEDTSMILFRSNGRIMATSANNWIVRDPQLGYIVLDDATFGERYHIDKEEGETFSI